MKLLKLLSIQLVLVMVAPAALVANQWKIGIAPKTELKIYKEELQYAKALQSQSGNTPATYEQLITHLQELSMKNRLDEKQLATTSVVDAAVVQYNHLLLFAKRKKSLAGYIQWLESQVNAMGVVNR